MEWQAANPCHIIIGLTTTGNLCFPTGCAQFQSCHDATGCGGNEVTGVSTARDCCLGGGLSFRDGGTCRQCIGKQLIVFLKLLQSR